MDVASPPDRTALRRALVRICAPLLAVVASLLLAHHGLLQSRLSRIPGDPGDVRLVHFWLEHLWGWLTGAPIHRSYWDLPFFFPAPNVGAYGDAIVGAALPYLLPRALGAGPERAYAFWLLGTTALNALAGTWFFRSTLGVSRLAATGGAVLLSAGAPRAHALNHPQLLACYWTLAVIALVVVALRRRGTRAARAAWIGAGLCFAAQAWSSYYLWWFLALAFALAAVAILADRELRPWIVEPVRRDSLAIGAAAGLAGLLLFPLLHAWWSAATVVGLRHPGEVFLARGQSWINPGADSWWYGGLVRHVRGLASQSGEHLMGVGVLTSLAAGTGLWRSRQRVGVVVLATVALALIVLSTQLGPWPRLSPWRLVLLLVPGARAIRAVPRLGLLVLVAWAAGLALCIEAVRRRRPALAALLALACLLEQGLRFAHFDPAVERARAEEVARALPEGCAAFAYTPQPDGWPPWRSQTVAMWATDLSGVPTLNGYSGNVPPGWPLDDCIVHGPADRERLDAAVAGWVRRWALPGKVCRVPAQP